MKIQIRKGLFETNSSSTHSVTVALDNDKSVSHFDPYHDILKSDIPDVESLKVDSEDNMVHVCFGEFGWEDTAFNNPYDKLSYVLTMVYETEYESNEDKYDFYNYDKEKFIKDFAELTGFKNLNEAVKSECNCDGIYIASDVRIVRYSNTPFLEVDGYIDHQSGRDLYSSFNNFLDEYGLTTHDYLFDKNVVVITTNDNRYVSYDSK